MVDDKRKNLLLFAITIFAFAYRLFLMTMNTFPPGADIGLHQSVIASMTSGKTDFFINYYHMGGGISVTNPGYHIFASFIISMTGMQDYLAQAVVACFFSAFMVPVVFLILKYIWNESAAFIAAILVTFSASDIIILSWAGYPNIVTLTLIPLVFYLFLKLLKHHSKGTLIGASLIISSIFITHVFSGLIFLVIGVLWLLLLVILRKKIDLALKQIAILFLPIILGISFVSLYLFRILPVYFGAEGTITSNVSQISQAIIQTRTIPIEFILLGLFSALLILFFNRIKNKRFLTFSSILFTCWILVPILASQTFHFGIYLDYERFLYFLSVPAIICLALAISYSAKQFSKLLLSRFKKLQSKTILRFKPSNGPFFIIAVALLVCCLFTPLFSLPNSAVSQVNFFQVMNTSKYQAIQWIKANTSSNSVCVADAELGWWISGFAQRPTLSAVSPQFLILNRELEPASVARNLLKADYIIDNGLLQIEQEGTYQTDNSHKIFAIMPNLYIEPIVFSLNDSQTNVIYRINNEPNNFDLSQLDQTDARIERSFNEASLVIIRENQNLKVTEQITLLKGINFAKISFSIENLTNNIRFDWLQIPFQSRGFPIQYNNSIALIDGTLNVLNQIIFTQGTLGTDLLMQENPDSYQLVFDLKGRNKSETFFYAGLSHISTNTEIVQVDYWNKLIENNTLNYLEKTTELPLTCFDYQTAIRNWNISYIAVRDAKTLSRFSSNLEFSTVFKNDEVTIFKIQLS